MSIEKISLAGEWKLEIEELKEQGMVQIPGILQEQGYGCEITTKTNWQEGLHDRLWYQRKEYQYAQENGIKVPFTCQPPKHYLGKVIYKKTFVIDKKYTGMPVEFHIEKTRWKTDVTLDERYIGNCTSLCAPHSYKLGALKEGLHTLEVCVDNTMQYPYRPEAHSVSDALAATWNGMVGEVYLQIMPLIAIQECKIFPVSEGETRIANVELRIENATVKKEDIKLICNGSQEFIKEVQPGENLITIAVNYPKESALWDEYQPELQSLDICLVHGEAKSYFKDTFGFRKIEAKNGQFLLNERPIYFRGNHYGGGYPLTGYPDTSKAYWKKVLGILKDWGMNSVRFHSYCPAKEAFAAADEMGIYFLIEPGMWNVFYEGNGMEEILDAETKAVLDAFGNHPSFVLFSPSNEPTDPKGEWLEPLSKWVKKWKKVDSRHLYTIQSGWPYPIPPSQIEGTDYVYFHRSGCGLEPGGTIRNSPGWREKDYRESVEGIKYPVISHELGQWCAYPDFEVIKKFTGFLKPGNYEIFKENAKANKVYQYNQEFVYNSGRLQYTLYKEDIEANFRTPHIYGYEMLDLRDYFGQGTALVGMLDPFWEEKGYVTKEEFKQFNNETVPLLRINKRVFESGEEIKAELEFAHFGKETLKDVPVYVKMIDEEGSIYAQKSCVMPDFPQRKNIVCMEIAFQTEIILRPKQYQIKAGIEGTDIQNSWNVWVYPREREEQAKDVIYTKDWQEAKTGLLQGRKVLFTPTQMQLSYKCPPLSFKSIFWNAQMGPTYRRMMGIVCDETHEALRAFPTKSYADWQWEEILDNAVGINLETLPELTCIVRVIDDWNRNYPLGLVFECRVGEGKLLVTGADLEASISGKQLKYSILEYAQSEKFIPESAVTIEALEGFMLRRDTMQVLQAKAFVEEDTRLQLEDLFDGDGETGIVSKNLGFPYHIHMTWERKMTLQGFAYLPRQNHRNLEGAVFEYELYTVENDIQTKVMNGEFVSTFEEQTIRFEKEIESTHMVLLLKSPFSDEEVLQWEMQKSGWTNKKGTYADTCFSMNAFSFIVKEDLGEVRTLQKREKKVAKSVTGDIEN